MNIKTVFLNADLDGEIYMVQPKGFIVNGQEHKLCRLIKPLYVLKQASKQWHKKFDYTIIISGFKINEYDKCVYIKELKDSCVIIYLYVDDILITNTNKKVINETKKMLSSSFDMKDMGKVNVILGVQVKQTSKGYCLTQLHYVEKILKFGQFDRKSAIPPIEAICKVRKNKSECKSQLEDSQVIGSLMYILRYTRPYIVYLVGRFARYISNPEREHWHALARLLRYLKHTINYGLHYTR